MRRIPYILIVTLVCVCLLSGCAGGGPSSSALPGYTQISQREALEMMESTKDCIILDVRREDEFAQGHIPGAVLLPNESIDGGDIAGLPDKEQVILVYCRSGNRSRQAAEKLAEMGYVNVYEFGGINTWPGEITTE